MSTYVAISVPEPDPINKGIIVPDKLIQYIKESSLGSSTKDKAVRLILERDAFGRNKYGQPLRSEDGRDSIEDARQEVGDLMNYVYKAKINGVDLTIIRQYLPVLQYLLEE